MLTSFRFSTRTGRELSRIVVAGFIVLLITCGFSNSNAETGTITGTILDAYSKAPLVGANVTLIGTQRGAASDNSGYFTIKNLPAGAYQIKVSYMGYESGIKEVAVQQNAQVHVEFKLREDFFQTEQIVVTATRTEKMMEDVPVVTEFISRAEIEEKGAEDLSEILDDRPGITIESGTTGGKFFYMNGVDSRRVLILVDNVPLSGKLNNRIQLNLIDSDKIDHIEIVKGPGSALYGNDAMGGVINVITKKYTDDLRLQAKARTGSNDLYSGNVTLSGAAGKLGYVVNVDHSQTGFDQGASEIEVKDTKTTSFGGKIKYSNDLLGDFVMNNEYRQDEQNSVSSFMGSTNDNTAKIDNISSSLNWNKNFFSNLAVNLTGYFADNFRSYESSVQNSPMPASIDTTTDRIFGLKSDFTYTPSNIFKFDFGFDYSDNDYENERLPAVQTRTQSGIFTQLETNLLEKFTIVVGSRFDKITDVKGYFSPRVSAMYELSSDLKLRASYGGGFRAPSFIELYSDFPIPIPGMPLKVVGNPDLKPEKSRGGNLGLEYFWNSFLLVNATFFQNIFEDMIVDYEPKPLTYSYLNVENATFRGMELQSRFYLLNNLTATLSYNFTDIAQKDDDVTFSKISPHTGSVRLVYGLLENKLKISLRDQFFSQRDILVVSGHSADFVNVTKDAYNLIDATVSYQLNDMITFRLGTTNLTDYTDLNYGPYVGRQIFVGIDTNIQN